MTFAEISPSSVLIILSLALGATFNSLRFRSGRSRSTLWLYRRESLPATYRNVGLVLPIATASMIGAIPFVVGATLSDGGPVPSPVVGVAVACMSMPFYGISAALVIASRSPRWIIPKWLAEENERLGLQAPRPDWFDACATFVGLIGGLVSGSMFLVVGIWFMIGGIAGP